MLVDGTGVPLAALLTPGQAHESSSFEALASSGRVRRPRGRPRQWPRRIGADRAYHAQRIRQWIRAHGMGAVIPPRGKPSRQRRGRPVSYDTTRYRGRNVAERCIGWLKDCRSVATRYEKLAVHYLALVELAMIERYLKLLAPA